MHKVTVANIDLELDDIQLNALFGNILDTMEASADVNTILINRVIADLPAAEQEKLYEDIVKSYSGKYLVTVAGKTIALHGEDTIRELFNNVLNTNDSVDPDIKAEFVNKAIASLPNGEQNDLYEEIQTGGIFTRFTRFPHGNLVFDI